MSINLHNYLLIYTFKSNYYDYLYYVTCEEESLSVWWGACCDVGKYVCWHGGVYAEVSCGVSGNMYVYSKSYNPHEIIIISRLYYIYIRLAHQYLHIIYPFFFSHKCLTKLFLYNITFSSVSISIHECDFLTLFSFYFYFVIIHFTLLCIFIGLYYLASTCTCAIRSYTVTYIYMYFILMFNAVSWLSIFNRSGNSKQDGAY